MNQQVELVEFMLKFVWAEWVLLDTFFYFGAFFGKNFFVVMPFYEHNLQDRIQVLKEEKTTMIPS